jgi:hypothetical protein
MTTTITLKNGQTANISYTILTAGGAAFDLDGYTVTLVVSRRGKRLQVEGTNDSPSTLGTGVLAVTATAYEALPPGTYDFELWLDDSADENIPVLSGQVVVLDVPQRV